MFGTMSFSLGVNIARIFVGVLLGATGTFLLAKIFRTGSIGYTWLTYVAIVASCTRIFDLCQVTSH